MANEIEMSAQNTTEQEMDCESHNQGQDNFASPCNQCKNYVETRFHCTVCDDFDLCTVCKEEVGHEHAMEKLGLDLDEESPNDLKQTNPQEARKQSIKRCIKSLVHACRCQEQQCPQPSCMKMKRVVAHTKICKRKTNGGCPICKQLIALCCYHAKYCNEVECLVPFCPNIKYKLKQQQLVLKLKQERAQRIQKALIDHPKTKPWHESFSSDLRKIIISTFIDEIIPISECSSLLDESEQQYIMLASRSEVVAYEIATSRADYYNVLGKKISEIKFKTDMQQVKETQSSVSSQNPHQGQQAMANANQQQSTLNAGNFGNARPSGNMMQMNDQNSQFSNNANQSIPQPNPQLMQPNPQILQQGMGQNAQNIGNQGHKQALQQLMMLLRNQNPTNPDVQQQILDILKSNPQLMSAFKQRQAQNQNSNAPGDDSY